MKTARVIPIALSQIQKNLLGTLNQGNPASCEAIVPVPVPHLVSRHLGNCGNCTKAKSKWPMPPKPSSLDLGQGQRENKPGGQEAQNPAVLATPVPPGGALLKPRGTSVRPPVATGRVDGYGARVTQTCFLIWMRGTWENVDPV